MGICGFRGKALLRSMKSDFWNQNGNRELINLKATQSIYNMLGQLRFTIV